MIGDRSKAMAPVRTGGTRERTGASTGSVTAKSARFSWPRTPSLGHREPAQQHPGEQHEGEQLQQQADDGQRMGGSAAPGRWVRAAATAVPAIGGRPRRLPAGGRRRPDVAAAAPSVRRDPAVRRRAGRAPGAGGAPRPRPPRWRGSAGTPWWRPSPCGRRGRSRCRCRNRGAGGDSSLSTPWRFRITGWDALNLSATSWAWLNDFGEITEGLAWADTARTTDLVLGGGGATSPR